MNITRFAIKKPVGITMIVLFFVVLGLFSFYRIGVELLPAINTPFVTVTVKYPGAGTEQIEQDVIKPLEDSLSSLSNLKHMTSIRDQKKQPLFWNLNSGPMPILQPSMRPNMLILYCKNCRPVSVRQ